MPTATPQSPLPLPVVDALTRRRRSPEGLAPTHTTTDDQSRCRRCVRPVLAPPPCPRCPDPRRSTTGGRTPRPRSGTTPPVGVAYGSDQSGGTPRLGTKAGSTRRGAYLDRQGGGASVSILGFWQDGTSPSCLTYTITAGFPHAQRSPGRGSRVATMQVSIRHLWTSMAVERQLTLFLQVRACLQCTHVLAFPR